jgi:RHH-type transcriptional regulator, proline utilization regulon repressor / proline dehydrogenase / delta 1-pyrroline-5-carboxylate dehydrogenase
MFNNHPPLDFSIKATRLEVAKALENIENKRQNNQLISRPIINGVSIPTNNKQIKLSPNNSSCVLGEVYFADAKLVYEALEKLLVEGKTWEFITAEKRAEHIFKLGHLIAQNRLELMALIIHEAGKAWVDADAEVVEAIDFCNYYASESLKLSNPQEVNFLGQRNSYYYRPRGIVAVISPWNFPLAILCGMTTAALVTGNRVAIKPAEQTSLVASYFANLLQLADIPNSAWAFLPGEGEVVGEMLVNSPSVDMVCFTGSKEVGFNIIERSAKVKEGQREIRKVVAELGGKNCLIIDSSADLDSAIPEVIRSCFGFAGQKCSAASRLIIVGDRYEAVLERLLGAAESMIIGSSLLPESFLGPLIDSENQARVLDLIAKFEGEYEVLFKGKQADSGYFVPPIIFKNVSTGSEIWNKELFAPILAVINVGDFSEAITIANRSDYALTGAVFSRRPSSIEYAQKFFDVGNLYINQGTTGAIVKRQPFGGHRHSGVGAKAGGPDYLLQFVTGKTVTENTTRKGYAPEFDSLS